jgi:hypothetical protein
MSTCNRLHLQTLRSQPIIYAQKSPQSLAQTVLLVGSKFVAWHVAGARDFMRSILSTPILYVTLEVTSCQEPPRLWYDTACCRILLYFTRFCNFTIIIRTPWPARPAAEARGGIVEAAIMETLTVDEISCHLMNLIDWWWRTRGWPCIAGMG